MHQLEWSKTSNQVIELYVLLSLFIYKTMIDTCIWCRWWWCFYYHKNWITCLIVFFTYYSIIFLNNLWFVFFPFRSVFCFIFHLHFVRLSVRRMCVCQLLVIYLLLICNFIPIYRGCEQFSRCTNKMKLTYTYLAKFSLQCNCNIHILYLFWFAIYYVNYNISFINT